MIYKIEKPYRVTKKLGAFISLLLFFALFEGALMGVEEFLKIPLGNYWFIPLSVTLLTITALLFIKDFLLFLKIWIGYNTIASFLAIILFTLEIIYISLPLTWYFRVAIYSFLFLFCGALVYDIKNITKSFRSQNIEANINKNLYTYEENSTIASLYTLRSLSHNNYSESNLLIMKLFIFFGLPFVLLGKGASYFLVLGIGEYFSVRGYIVVVLGFILIVFIFAAALFPASTIAIRLKYKNDGK